MVLEGVDDLGEVHLNGEGAESVGRRGKVIAERKESGLDGVTRLSGVEVVLNDSHEDLADAAELAVQQVPTDRIERKHSSITLGGAGSAVSASKLRRNSRVLSSTNGLDEGIEGVLALCEAIGTETGR